MNYIQKGSAASPELPQRIKGSRFLLRPDTGLIPYFPLPTNPTECQKAAFLQQEKVLLKKILSLPSGKYTYYGSSPKRVG